MAQKQYVAQMFDDIAGRYDFLNHFLSLGIDKRWRKRLVRELKLEKPTYILDVATGTGDSAIALLKTGATKVTGVDISKNMLEQGKIKIENKKLCDKIELKYGDAEELDFDSDVFDAVTVAFGVRNFENLNKGLAEIYRVVKPGGSIAVLEFSLPKNIIVRKIYSFYFFYILPFFGRMFSKNRSAYSYLPESVKTFPKREEFLDCLQKEGFVDTRRISLSLGVAEIYMGKKLK